MSPHSAPGPVEVGGQGGHFPTQFLVPWCSKGNMIVSQKFLVFSVCLLTFGLLPTPLSGAYEIGGQGGH